MIVMYRWILIEDSLSQFSYILIIKPSSLSNLSNKIEIKIIKYTRIFSCQVVIDTSI
jgi:hypothetical protein